MYEYYLILLYNELNYRVNTNNTGIVRFAKVTLSQSVLSDISQISHLQDLDD